MAGIINSAQTPTAEQQDLMNGFGWQSKNYNGEQVRVDDAMKQGIADSAAAVGMSAQDYDKMVNPTTYGARWGVVEKQKTAMPPIQVGTPDQNPSSASAPTISAPASTYNPVQLGNPTQWNVTPQQTVEGRISSILGADNPIIQQARTRAMQQMNSRGLANSSMAIGAGESAAYDAAMPIATADAATVARAASYNADESNQFAVANQNASNTGGQFNATAQNTLAGQQLAANTQLATANISANTQRYMSDQSAQTQLAVAKMSNQSQQAISQLHDANSVLLQNNQSAQQAYSNYVNAVANIDLQTTMPAEAKAAAIKTQTDIFNNAVAGLRAATSGTPDVSSPLNVNGANTAVSQAVSAVNGVDVSSMLNFGADR